MTGFHWISGSFQTSCKAQDCEKPRAGFLRTLQFLNSLESSPGYNNRNGAKDLAPEKSLIQVMTRINRKNSVKYQVWHREKRQTYDFRLEIIVPHLILPLSVPSQTRLPRPTSSPSTDPAVPWVPWAGEPTARSSSPSTFPPVQRGRAQQTLSRLEGHSNSRPVWHLL